jgi:hypothetical protein
LTTVNDDGCKVETGQRRKETEMGYSYTMSGGRHHIDCDACGRSSIEGAQGVRKRTCPFKVNDRGTRGGEGHSLPWCPPPALCSECFAKYGGSKGVHKDCREPAASAQARHDAERARLDTGDGMCVCREPLSGGDVRTTYRFADGREVEYFSHRDEGTSPTWYRDIEAVWA